MRYMSRDLINFDGFWDGKGDEDWSQIHWWIDASIL